MSSDLPPWSVVLRTLGRDVRAGFMYLRILSFMKRCHFTNTTLVDLFDANVQKHRDDVLFVYQNEEWTYGKVDEVSNRVAHAFLEQGLTRGDQVALLMSNCPDYVCMWLGLAKIGVATALINTNLRLEALAHSFNVVDIKAIIYGGDFTQAVKEALPFIKRRDSIQFYCYYEEAEKPQVVPPPHLSLNSLLDESPCSKVNFKKLKGDFTAKLLYIYTSGTTGMPKAAIIRNSRMMMLAGTKYLLGMTEDDVVYNTLPLYHTAGGALCLSPVLAFGGKMVLRKKFSATNFWKEAARHKCTMAQYIGEICRYLLNQPESPEETNHSIRLMIGNGLRPHIWEEFQPRFQLDRIVEIYGATEGNANIVNIFGKPGAVGFLSLTFHFLYPVYLIKVDPETGQPMRDDNGLCIKCKPGEPGEMVGKIVRQNPINMFDGYADPQETRKKIVRDCFRKGDQAFLSGDILVMDDCGYLYFVDRTGDTFRWKGENVSTGEVEKAISKALNHITCVVYGVQIPNVEGRAGMAAIQCESEGLDFHEFFKNVSRRLPLYSVPLFLRISADIEATGTYKLRKVSLQKDGFDVTCVADPMYFVDYKNKTYVPLTKELYSNIMDGTIRL